jgi:uncharacterized damage-inducible protein DinB
MNDDFASLYAFNRWADRRVLDACRKLTPEQYAAEPVPGWSSVRQSVVHNAVVMDAWLSRLAGQVVDGPIPAEADFPTIADAERVLERAEQTLQKLLPMMTPEWLTTPQTLRGRGRVAVLPPWAVLRHVVNHSTYHRGQIASKLKRLGVEQAATDFVFWAMEWTPQTG